jgi:multidrug resistance efflux pump
LNPSQIDAALAEAEARLSAHDATVEELEQMTHKVEVARVHKELLHDNSGAH